MAKHRDYGEERLDSHIGDDCPTINPLAMTTSEAATPLSSIDLQPIEPPVTPDDRPSRPSTAYVVY